MIYKINENIYRRYKGYKFISETFLNNNKKVVYCLVAKKNKKVECLIQQARPIKNDEKDKTISDYLNHKTQPFELDDGFSKAKDLVEITSYNINN